MSRLTADLNFTSGHERTLLAAAMNGGNGDFIVTADDFFSPPHRQIFNLIARLPCSQRNLYLWVTSVPISAATGWRWRKHGWIPTINIAGRLYVSRAAIPEFEKRAAAGEFSSEHVTPKRRVAR